MVGHTVKHFVAGPTPSLWDDINSSIQKLDPMHVDVSNSCYSPGPGSHKFRDPDYRGDPEVCGDEGIKSEPMYLGDGEGYVNDAYNQVTICWNMLQHGQELKTSSQLDVVTLQILYLFNSNIVITMSCLQGVFELAPGGGEAGGGQTYTYTISYATSSHPTNSPIVPYRAELEHNSGSATKSWKLSLNACSQVTALA